MQQEAWDALEELAAALWEEG